MASYDRNFTDELRTRLSIVDVVSRRVPLVKKGQNYWGCCPFHNEKTPSFSVSEEKGFYHCFGCGEHGDIISFTMKINNIDFRAAITELAAQAGLKLPEYKPKSDEQIAREESYFDIMDTACKIYTEKLFSPDGAHALEYIRRRGFSDEMIKKYRIGYAPKNNIISNKFVNTRMENVINTGLCRRGDYGLYDFFRDKLMFPIFSPRGQIVAFSGRSLDGSEPKYINTSDTELFHKRHTIFGLNFARDAIHRANRSIVVEGQIDAIQMQNNGFPETIAPLGTALTEEHIAILCKSNRNIVFCFDGDNAGQKAAVRACGIVMPFLRDNSDVKFAFVTGGKDPDDVLKTSGVDAMRKIIDSATPLVDFLWNTVNKNYLINTPNGRTQAEKFLTSQISKITDIKLRAEYENEYNSRKFNAWHKWKKKSDAPVIDVPDIDSLTRNTLTYIAIKYPELAERHAEFLASLNISLDDSAPEQNLDFTSAEKYIVSLKLNNRIKKLIQEKKSAMADIVSGAAGDMERVNQIDAEIAKCREKLETITDIV